MTRWLLARLWRGAGRMQWVLAVVLMATTALATVVVLVVSSVPAAFERQADRAAWASTPDWTLQADPETDPDAVYLHSTGDTVADRAVTVVQVATLGAGVPAPEGLISWPGPGQSWVSPALDQALRDTPAAAGRYGQVVGQIGPATLRGPQDLLVVRGVEPSQLEPVAVPVTGLAEEPRGVSSSTLTMMLGLAGVAVLVPPLLLAYAATSGLAQAHRRRMANLVIAGTPARLIRRIVAGESLAAAMIGVLAGGVLFLAARPALVGLLVVDPVPYPTDLVPRWPVVALIAVALPALVTGLGVWTARDVVHNPLTSTSTAREATPPWWVAAAGGLLTAAAVVAGWAQVFTGTRQTLVLMGLGGAGLALLLPWICTAIGRLMLTSRRPTLVLGGGWLHATPWATARGILAPCLAIFVATVFVLANPAAVASAPTPVITQAAGTITVTTRTLPGPQVAELEQDIGQVEGIGTTAQVLTGTLQTGSFPLTVWIGDCPSIAAAAAMNDLSCEQDVSAWSTPEAAGALAAGGTEISNLAPAQIVSMTQAPDSEDPWSLPAPATTSPVLTTPAQAVDRPHLVIDPARTYLDTTAFRPTVLLARAASTTDLDQVRTLAAAADPVADTATPETSRQGYDGSLQQYYSLMLWGAGATFLTAAGALFATALTGIVRRTASTAVLAAIGTPTVTLRGAVLLSITAPLTLTAVLASAVGLSVTSSLLNTGGAELTGLTGLWPLLPSLLAVVLFAATSSLAIPATARVTDLPGE